MTDRHHATIYLEQSGEVLFTHKASSADRDEEGVVRLTFAVWKFSGMKGYTVGEELTARVEWHDEAGAA